MILVVIISLATVMATIYFTMRQEQLKMKRQWENNRAAAMESQAELSGR